MEFGSIPSSVSSFVARNARTSTSHDVRGFAQRSKPPYTPGIWHMVFLQHQINCLFFNASIHEEKNENMLGEIVAAYDQTSSGWWWMVAINLAFSQKYWEFHHPNWLLFFSEGWPNHQPVIDIGLFCKLFPLANPTTSANCSWGFLNFVRFPTVGHACVLQQRPIVCLCVFSFFYLVLSSYCMTFCRNIETHTCDCTYAYMYLIHIAEMIFPYRFSSLCICIYVNPHKIGN